MNHLFAKALGALPFSFPKRHGLIKRLWNEGQPPIIHTIAPLSFGDLSMYADSRNHIEWHILVYGCYEKELVQTMLKLIKDRPKRNAIDIGANSGQYSLILSRYFDRVYSFEPVPQFYEKLQANIKLNHIKNITASGLALGNRENEIKMAVLHHHDLAQTASWDRNKYDFKDPFQWESVLVKQVKLDDVLQSGEGVDFIKIDTDGSEAEILEGASKTIRNYKPLIQIELIDYVKGWLGEKNLEDIVRFLKNFGYEMYDYRRRKCINNNYSGNYFAIPS